MESHLMLQEADESCDDTVSMLSNDGRRARYEGAQHFER